MMNGTTGGLRGWFGRAKMAARRALVHRVYAPLVYPIEQRLRTVPNPLLRRRLAHATPPDMAPAAEALRRDGTVILPGF